MLSNEARVVLSVYILSLTCTYVNSFVHPLLSSNRCNWAVCEQVGDKDVVFTQQSNDSSEISAKSTSKNPSTHSDTPTNKRLNDQMENEMASSSSQTTPMSDPSTDPSDFKTYKKGWSSMNLETPFSKSTPIHGLIPSDFPPGTYYRVGPALFTPGTRQEGNPNKAYLSKRPPLPQSDVKHVFEGDGGIIGVTIGWENTTDEEEEGGGEKERKRTVTFRSRFVRTAGFMNERKVSATIRGPANVRRLGTTLFKFTTFPKRHSFSSILISPPPSSARFQALFRPRVHPYSPSPLSPQRQRFPRPLHPSSSPARPKPFPS